MNFKDFKGSLREQGISKILIHRFFVFLKRDVKIKQQFDKCPNRIPESSNEKLLSVQ